jgi:hypothetical protein
MTKLLFADITLGMAILFNCGYIYLNLTGAPTLTEERMLKVLNILVPTLSIVAGLLYILIRRGIL